MIGQRTSLGLLIASVFFGGCALPTDADRREPTAVEIVSAPTTVELDAFGATVAFQARVLDQFGEVMEDQSVAWTVGDSTVMEPLGDGSFRSRGNGVTQLFAEVAPATPRVEADGYFDGKARAAVQVRVAQVPVALKFKSASLRFWSLRAQQQAAVVLVDANGYAVDRPLEVLWSALDSGIASIDGSGVITAVGDGTSTVKAQAAGLEAALEVQVSATIPVAGCLSWAGAAQASCRNTRLIAHTPAP